MDDWSQSRKLAAVASIHDPIRRQLYEFIMKSGAAVGRDEAAAAIGTARGTAAFHLDRLVEDGVLQVEFKRLSGKTGPGSGRPSKLYRPVPGELAVSIPERKYELAGEIMASAIDHSAATGQPIGESLRQVAFEAGNALGASTGSLERVLIDTGYEPKPDGEGGYDFENCPFHHLARSHTDTICGLNGCFLEGALCGADDVEHSIRPPEAGARCCARIGLQGA